MSKASKYVMDLREWQEREKPAAPKLVQGGGKFVASVDDNGNLALIMGGDLVVLTGPEAIGIAIWIRDTFDD